MFCVVSTVSNDTLSSSPLRPYPILHWISEPRDGNALVIQKHLAIEAAFCSQLLSILKVLQNSEHVQMNTDQESTLFKKWQISSWIRHNFSFGNSQFYSFLLALEMSQPVIQSVKTLSDALPRVICNYDSSQIMFHCLFYQCTLKGLKSNIKVNTHIIDFISLLGWILFEYHLFGQFLLILSLYSTADDMK